MMESLPASATDVIEASLAMVDDADLYIGVLGHRYGYCPPGQEISITELEYGRAVAREIPRLMFLMGDDHPVKIADVEMGAPHEKLEAFKHRVRQEQVVKYFGSSDALREEVLHSISAALEALRAEAAESDDAPARGRLERAPASDIRVV